jgi:hypothetical protein
MTMFCFEDIHMASAKALSRYGQDLVWNVQACNMRTPLGIFCLFVFSLTKVCENWLFWQARIVETNVVCGNGLGLTLRVSVNADCEGCRCKCKNKYTYMVLYNYVK